MTSPHRQVVATVSAWTPRDDLGVRHREQALTWLAATEDIYRRIKPDTPPQHLVAYFLLVDRAAGRVLLCDHRLAGLWLPTGGHVEPGEDPTDTVRREVVEELGVEAEFDPALGEAPFLLTVTRTTAHSGPRHVDVSLWFALRGRVGDDLTPDAGEFAGVRWWSRSEIEADDPGHHEPHILRALDALGLSLTRPSRATSELIASRRHVPPVDPAALQADLDEFLDAQL